MSIEDYLYKICQYSSVIKKDKDALIFDRISEVTVNGIEYQVQVVLEPNKKDWIAVPKARKTIL